MVELQFLCEELKSNNIAFMVKGESAGEIYGIIWDGLAEKKIYVMQQDAAAAREIIEGAVKAYKDSKPESDI